MGASKASVLYIYIDNARKLSRVKVFNLILVEYVVKK